MSPATPRRSGTLALGGAAHPTGAPAAAAAARPQTLPVRAEEVVLVRRLAARLRETWLPRAAWTIGRTGRPGLVGIALLLAAALFRVSTHRQVAAEVDALRAELAAARGQARAEAPVPEGDRAPAARALPARTEMPAILRQLFKKATEARLALDTGKYEVNATRRSGVIRYQVVFPVAGPYPQIRRFLDGTLAALPDVALSELALERKSISDERVEAQIRLTVYTAAAGGTAAAGAASGRAPDPPPARDRVVAPTHAAALFAQHSWFVLPPAPTPPPPPPPPQPTAPPLPYAFLGSFSPGGEKPVFFLARGDRVIDVRVGDRLDGVYQLESAAGGQLVFVYLPLGVRQTLAAGASR